MFARLYLIVLCAALLAPQAGFAHAHLCLDGAGPAVTMHLADRDNSCSHVSGADHHDHAIDVGVDVERPAAGKTWPSVQPGALFLVVPRVEPPHAGFRFLATLPDLDAPATPLHLRPPLRGPPA